MKFAYGLVLTMVACATTQTETPGASLAPVLSDDNNSATGHLQQSVIALPEVSPEVRKELGLPAEGEVPASVRAWQYKPGLTQALQQLGGAIVQDMLLPKDLALQLVVVVTARLGCLY
jgi:hypothetical protein